MLLARVMRRSILTALRYHAQFFVARLKKMAMLNTMNETRQNDLNGILLCGYTKVIFHYYHL